MYLFTLVAEIILTTKVGNNKMTQKPENPRTHEKQVTSLRIFNALLLRINFIAMSLNCSFKKHKRKKMKRADSDIFNYLLERCYHLSTINFSESTCDAFFMQNQLLAIAGAG